MSQFQVSPPYYFVNIPTHLFADIFTTATGSAACLLANLLVDGSQPQEPPNKRYKLLDGSSKNNDQIPANRSRDSDGYIALARFLLSFVSAVNATNCIVCN